jgi:PleD family two-component response regulator
MAIHELLTVNDEVRELISRRASEHAIRKAARNAGMRTLLEDGILKAAQGRTTLEDVVRVVAADDAAHHKEEATKPSVTTSPDVPYEITARKGEAAQEGQPEPDETAPPVEEEGSKPGAPTGKERVLVVEDSRTIAQVVKYFLELEGFEVLVAKDGTSGLEAAKRDQPHVIVTDYNMPGMDGLAMVRALRADARTRDIAVLMLTSENSVEKEAQALEAGVDDYILKPVEPRRLAARVKSVLARAKQRQVTVSQ